VKIRNGFVSNSSSSSFIIAFKNKKDDECPLCGKYSSSLETNIYKHFQSNNWHGDTELFEKNLRQFIDEYVDDENISEILEKLKDKKDKYGFLCGTISYHDDYLDNLNDLGLIEFIWKRGE
jgi:hypothetical protein